MFLGTYAPKLDEKGRVILPAKFRDELSHGLVITRGREGCLVIYSAREFENVHEQLMAAASSGSKRARDAQRMLLASASEEHLDAQNRITVPTMLREHAHLTRDLAVIGNGNRIEMWNSVAWDEYYAQMESAYEDSDEEVIPGLF